MAGIQINSPKQCCELITQVAVDYDNDLMKIPDDHPVILAAQKYFKEHPDEPKPRQTREAYDSALSQIKPLWEQGFDDQTISLKVNLAPATVRLYRRQWGKCNKRAWQVEHDGQCDIMNSLKEFQAFLGVSRYMSSQRVVKTAIKRGYKVSPAMSHNY